MQTAFVKTSVSFPPEVYAFLKSKAAETGAPISRIIAKAIRQEAAKEKKGARK